MTNKKFLRSLKWIFEVSNRFANVDKKGKAAVTSTLSILGIALGVATLIVVLSVMNGFQRSFIDSIMEISSYHVRVKEVPLEIENDFLDFISNQKNVISISPFYETQALVVSNNKNESAGIIRAIEKDALEKDAGLKKELKIIQGSFDISNEDSIVIGSAFAHKLGVSVGSKINLLAMAGGTDVALISNNRNFTITGIFESGYIEINDSFAFVNLEAANKYFGKDAIKNYGIKLKNYEKDNAFISIVKNKFSEVKIDSWKNYNRTFFSALRIEKNTLMLFIFIIFIVVGINIYNGIRRLVFERKQEISIFSALGGTKNEIRSIFVFRGFFTGFLGSLFGVSLGILLACNMDIVFYCLSKIMFFTEYFVTFIFNPNNLIFVTENSMYSIYASIPPRIFPIEIILISLFGVFTPVIASYTASNNILKLTISEVLHDE